MCSTSERARATPDPPPQPGTGRPRQHTPTSGQCSPAPRGGPRVRTARTDRRRSDPVLETPAKSVALALACVHLALTPTTPPAATLDGHRPAHPVRSALSRFLAPGQSQREHHPEPNDCRPPHVDAPRALRPYFPGYSYTPRPLLTPIRPAETNCFSSGQAR